MCSDACLWCWLLLFCLGADRDTSNSRYNLAKQGWMSRTCTSSYLSILYWECHHVHHLDTQFHFWQTWFSIFSWNPILTSQIDCMHVCYFSVIPVISSTDKLKLLGKAQSLSQGARKGMIPWVIIRLKSRVGHHTKDWEWLKESERSKLKPSSVVSSLHNMTGGVSSCSFFLIQKCTSNRATEKTACDNVCEVPRVGAAWISILTEYHYYDKDWQWKASLFG